MLKLVLLVLLLLLVVGALPSWPYSRGWGLFPAGTLGAVLFVVVLLAVLGRI
jgi:hypothetical protein